MNEPKYTDAIKMSWNFIWHHKILWGLGVLAMFVGQFGLGNYIGKFWMSGERMLKTSEPFGGVIKTWVSGYFPAQFNGFIVLWLLILILVVIGFVIFVSVIAQGALISASAHGYKHKKIGKIAQFWDQGVKSFWRVLVANFIEKIALSLLLFDLLYVWSFLYNSSCVYSTLFMTLSLAINLFLAIVVSVLFIYTVGYVVVDDKKIREAFKLAFGLFSRHILVSIELSFILLLLGIVLVAIIASFFIVLYLPSLLIGFIAGAFSSVSLLILGVSIGTLLSVGFIVLISGIFNAFTIGCWTFMFVRMHKEGLKSRIIHKIEKLFKR